VTIAGRVGGERENSNRASHVGKNWREWW
jgi:hypothetical protein